MPLSLVRTFCRINCARSSRRCRADDRRTISQQSCWVNFVGGLAVASAWRNMSVQRVIEWAQRQQTGVVEREEPALAAGGKKKRMQRVGGGQPHAEASAQTGM